MLLCKEFRDNFLEPNPGEILIGFLSEDLTHLCFAASSYNYSGDNYFLILNFYFYSPFLCTLGGVAFSYSFPFSCIFKVNRDLLFWSLIKLFSNSSVFLIIIYNLLYFYRYSSWLIWVTFTTFCLGRSYDWICFKLESS